MSKDNYKKLAARKKLKKAQKGGNGRKALILFESIPERFKNKVIEKIGDPYEQVKHIRFANYINPDYSAALFYQDYTMDNGLPLPEANIKEYTDTANILNAAIHIATKVVDRRSFGGKQKMWARMAAAVQALPETIYTHRLPKNARRFQQKVSNYQKEGYKSLIHGNFQNSNSRRLPEEAKMWVVARWADQVNKCVSTTHLLAEYEKEADIRGWKNVCEKTLYNFLHEEKIKHLWWGHRYGELKAKEKFNYQHSTVMPSVRDALWYSDGTKLNLYYLGKDGKMETTSVYEVMDAYSEAMLGYHISKNENYQSQYHAYKMAAKIAGHRPYEIKYDNQGGHKKLESGEFLGKLAKLSIRTQAYNGKSKSIELAFGRFQQQILKKFWYFTGQNINAKSVESRQNMEFILANKHNLPTLQEAIKAYVQAREEWNTAPHHETKQPRIEMYENSHNPESPQLSVWDQVDMFWILRKQPITCTAYGISFVESKVKYTYMVYDENKMPNTKWLEENIDKKFRIKFDPEDMSLIYLYEDTPKGLRFVTAAQTKIQIHRARQEQDAFEAAFIKGVEAANKAARLDRFEETEKILKKHSRSATDYGMETPTVKGIGKTPRRRKKVPKEDIGEYEKQMSNEVVNEEEFNLYNNT